MLVYEYDELKQTGLIWAAKRDYTVLAEKLVHARSRISFKDLLGRNALMLAVVNGNERLIRFLLCFNSNPLTRNNKGQAAIHMTDDQTIMSMMNRVATGRAGLNFISGKEKRYKWWKNEVLNYLDPEGALMPYYDKILLFKNS